VAVRGVVAVALLGIGIRGFSMRRGKSGNRKIAKTCRKPGWLDRASAAVLLVAMHAAFLWLLGSARPVIERIGLAAEPWLRPVSAQTRKENAVDAAESKSSGNWLWQDHRSRSLPARTDLRLGNRPEVFLRFTAPEDAAAVINGSAYLGSFMLSKFEDGYWATPTYEATAVEVNGDGWTRFPSFPSRSGTRAIGHEVFHGINASGQNVLIALQGVETVEVKPLEAYGDGFVMLPDPPENAIGFQYRATSRPLMIGDLPGNHPATAATSEPPAHLLEFATSPRIDEYLRNQTSAIIGDAPNMDSLKKLEAWLREAFAYSLVTDNSQNLDPLENFLFSERRGHCEHFAMTAALMLRSAGIPSRVAYGWAGGTWYGAQEVMVFRSRDAHAWTEVWIEGYGWAVMDPTPPAAVAGSQSRIAPPDELPPDSFETLPGENLIKAMTRIEFVAAWMLFFFSFAAMLMLWMRHRLRRGVVAGGVGGGESHHHTGYLSIWHAACPLAYPGETIRAQMLRQETPPSFAGRLVDYHYRVRYHASQRDTSIERELMRSIRKWRKPTHPLE